MIAIGTHQVGPGQKPFIIAEVGSNFTTLDDCMNSIALAKACGADAVKFQAYDHKALYGYDRIIKNDVRVADFKADPDNAPREDRKVDLPGTLPLEWLPKLADKARACGIEFMCSAFSPELAEAVNPFVNVHKIASAELTHLRLLQKIRSFGKPVILSTGASGEADIGQALAVLSGVPVILMYCVAAYPAKMANPWLISVMRSEYGVPVGYSDHSIDAIVTPVVAAQQGAVVIEKHVNFVNAQGPDAPHSLNTDEFKLMVRAVRGEAVSRLGATGEESGMIIRHNRRLIATRDIAEGEALSEGVNFGIYRSLKDDTKAASPWMIDQMNGKRALRAIPAGDGIAPGDV